MGLRLGTLEVTGRVALASLVIVVLVVAALWANWGWLFGSSADRPDADANQAVKGIAAPRNDTERKARALYRTASKRDSAQLPALTAALNDPAPKVREAAVLSLGFYAKEVDSGKLARVVRDDDSPTVRGSALALLGRQEKWENIPAMIVGLRDRSVEVRRRAYVALCDMLKTDFPFDPAADAARREAEIRRFEAFYPSIERHYRGFLRRKENKR